MISLRQRCDRSFTFSFGCRVQSINRAFVAGIVSCVRLMKVRHYRNSLRQVCRGGGRVSICVSQHVVRRHLGLDPFWAPGPLSTSWETSACAHTYSHLFKKPALGPAWDCTDKREGRSELGDPPDSNFSDRAFCT